MKKLLKYILAIFGFCIELGFVVSKVEKIKEKVGWIEGHRPYGFYERNVKRALDFGLSLFALIVLWPMMAVTGLLVRVKLGSPVLFKQERPGLVEKPFNLLKFRTMTNKRDENGLLLPDEERITPLGKIFRSTSIDELPSLLNIIRGEMAIVGPRPLLVKYLPFYTKYEHHRHDVRPGLTGYAQAHGRNAVNWDEKFQMDVDYAEHITFCGDLGIVFDTVKTVLKRDGIHSNTSATMESFVDYAKSRKYGTTAN